MKKLLMFVCSMLVILNVFAGDHGAGGGPSGIQVPIGSLGNGGGYKELPNDLINFDHYKYRRVVHYDFYQDMFLNLHMEDVLLYKTIDGTIFSIYDIYYAYMLFPKVLDLSQICPADLYFYDLEAVELKNGKIFYKDQIEFILINRTFYNF